MNLRTAIKRVPDFSKRRDIALAALFDQRDGYLLGVGLVRPPVENVEVRSLQCRLQAFPQLGLSPPCLT